jgi:hypothetical protein
MSDSIILAIDPGNEKSAWVLYDGSVLNHGYHDNEVMAKSIHAGDFRAETVVIEMIACYGMPVGAEVFDTCTWIGKYEWAARRSYGRTHRLFRTAIKTHLCGTPRAKDANVRQALIDRFGPGKDKAIGKKASPGPLFGLAGDEWSALAVGVCFADGIRSGE